MDRKSIFSFIFVILTAHSILSTNAAALTKSSKFSFPSHVVGTNHSVLNDLEPFLSYNPVNLGMDILDDDAPMNIRQAMANATLSLNPWLNQGTPRDGSPRLLKAIATFYSKLIGQVLDPKKNVVVTAGATEAVYSAFNGHTSPGDEWIIIEPAYVMYLPMIKLARGVPRFTALKQVKKDGDINGDDWVLDREQMESLFNEKTKGILLNNPLNPLGKVYTREELEFIASLAIKYNTLVISDEAHEWITFKPHIRIASLPGMFERTITIGSSSKSFSVSGWRLGWAYGPADILDHVKAIHGNVLYSTGAPQQDAIAYGFEEETRNFGKPESYFISHLLAVKKMRDTMVEAFKKTGMEVIIPDGGYCLTVNWTPLKNTILTDFTIESTSMDFIKWFIKEVGVLGFPVSAFYGENDKYMGEDYARFCFHKKHETLVDAITRLQKLWIHQ